MGKRRHHDPDTQNIDKPQKKRRGSAVYDPPACAGANAEVIQERSQEASSARDHVVRPVQVPHEVSSSVDMVQGEQTKVLDEANAQTQALNFSHLPFSCKGKSTTEKSTFPKYNGHPSTLPPLPAILDISLERTVFTHQGALNGYTTTKLDISYDRLEFLGDAYIELIATRLIFPRFPNLPAGRLSQQRELLVKNETLAQYSLAYGFDEKTRLPKSYRSMGQDRSKIKLWTKTMGDVFEAYVAAVILSDPISGYATAETWLHNLWSHKLGAQALRETHAVDPNSKVALAQKVLGKGIKLDYREEAPPDQSAHREGKLWFRLGVFLTGWGWENVRLGGGEGLNKQDAGNLAAAEALKNPLTAQIGGVKRAFDQKVKEKKEKEQKEEGDEGEDRNIASRAGSIKSESC